MLSAFQPLSAVAIYSIPPRTTQTHRIDKLAADNDRVRIEKGKKTCKNMENIKCLLFIVFATVAVSRGIIDADKTLEKVSDSWIFFFF